MQRSAVTKKLGAFLALSALATGLALGRLALADNDAEPVACAYEISPPDPPNQGILFVDHSRTGRSGHLGHALVEYQDGKILAFYPNCSDDNGGHSAVGWTEYRRSEDGGKTWGDPKVLAYSKNLLEAGQAAGASVRNLSAFAEKAVVTDSGEIVLFFLVCDISRKTVWSHFQVPTYVTSSDGGHTWSEPYELGDKRGRIYDARVFNGEILALNFANDNEISFLGNKQEHVYELYSSGDGGRTFQKRSELPFNTAGRSYGTIGLLESGSIVAYVYNRNDERALDFVVSDDGGRTWSQARTSQFRKKIRNPQLISLDGCYFMHGRSGSFGDEKGHMVLYSSQDGQNWDEGSYLRMREAGLGAYSNSTVIGSLSRDGPRRLLIQASHAYERNKTNVLHWWLETRHGHGH